jgi:DnaK suppressor protein
MGLDAKKIEALKEVIDQSLHKIEKDIDDLRESTKPVAPDNAIGRLSRMEAIGQKSVKDASLRRAEMRRQKLLETLKRIDKEDYGICVECDEPIEWARLKSLPESIVCVSCLKEAQGES